MKEDGNWESNRDSYSGANYTPKYGQTSFERYGIAYGPSSSNYPNLYKMEIGSGINTQNGNTRTDGIDKNYIAELDFSDSQSEKASIGMTVTETYYELDINESNFDEAFKALKSSTSYWVASRAVQAIWTGGTAREALFRLNWSSGSEISGICVYNSFYGNRSAGGYSLRPVITINSNVNVDISESASDDNGIPHHIDW